MSLVGATGRGVTGRGQFLGLLLLDHYVPEMTAWDHRPTVWGQFLGLLLLGLPYCFWAYCFCATT